MTCRHKEGDPTCTAGNSPKDLREKARRILEKWPDPEAPIPAAPPDAEQFRFEMVEQVGPHLVVKARYPSCPSCTFEGVKVMVFLNVDIRQAILWRRIDPHFREEDPPGDREAPGPAARFPATFEGWEDAIEYARNK